MIKNIIFDFDGTLVDTAPLILAIMKATVESLGLEPKSDDEYRSTIGLRLEEIPAALWPDRTALSAEYAATYRRLYEERRSSLNADCYPGVVDTVQYLRYSLGYRLAVASSRSHRSLVDHLEDSNIIEAFDAIVGGNDVACCKPAPDPVLAIANKLGWETEETLVVGDTVYDIEMGRNAGTLTCAVTYGNQDRNRLAESCPDYMISSFSSLIPLLSGVDPKLVDYVEREILPRYSGFDRAHREDHAAMVIAQSMGLARKMPGLDIDMLYAAAAFHDTGLVNGRENHHLDSGRILAADEFIAGYFTAQQIEMMKEAVEDHRASNGSKPRNDYGLVVAEADRFIDPVTIIKRTVQYGLAHYPELDFEGHFLRTIKHLEEKYGPDGYLKILIPWSENALRLKRLHTLIADRDSLRKMFTEFFVQETEETGS